MSFRHQVEAFLRSLQDDICTAIETTDGVGRFREDIWQHHSGGGGRTRIIQHGNIIEKGGVNFSAVSGPVSDALARQLKLDGGQAFFATGVSIVMHPQSPLVPIIHKNIRYFELSDGTCWFGGGIDLTPHYVVEDDARWFHTQLKTACDNHDTAFYAKFKSWADDYFFIPHRQETRGVGGIFYDYLKPSETQSADQIFAFMREIGLAFAPIYTHFMQKNSSLPFDESHKKWQMLRRGRYVEFNLAWDRGTKFGLETNGRTESILMSLPPIAHWEYDYQPIPDSPEAKTLAWLRKGVDWVE